MAATKIKFGFGQLFKATPDEVKKALTITSIIIGVLIIGITSSQFIPTNIKLELSGWLGAILSGVHSIGVLFGVEIQSPVVPRDQVTAIKD